MKNFSLNRMIVLLIASGFAFLLVETRIEHADVIQRHQFAILPIAFSFIGLVLAGITAWKWNERAIRALHVFLMLTALVGLTGMVLHNGDRFEGKNSEEGGVRSEEGKQENSSAVKPKKKKEDFPPMLAPMAFVGIAAVGLLGTSRRWIAESPVK